MPGLAGQEGAQVVGGDLQQAPARGEGGPGEMGGNHAVLGGEQGIVGRGRLGA